MSAAASSSSPSPPPSGRCRERERPRPAGRTEPQRPVRRGCRARRSARRRPGRPPRLAAARPCRRIVLSPGSPRGAAPAPRAPHVEERRRCPAGGGSAPSRRLPQPALPAGHPPSRGPPTRPGPAPPARPQPGHCLPPPASPAPDGAPCGSTPLPPMSRGEAGSAPALRRGPLTCGTALRLRHGPLPPRSPGHGPAAELRCPPRGRLRCSWSPRPAAPSCGRCGAEGERLRGRPGADGFPRRLRGCAAPPRPLRSRTRTAPAGGPPARAGPRCGFHGR